MWFRPIWLKGSIVAHFSNLKYVTETNKQLFPSGSCKHGFEIFRHTGLQSVVKTADITLIRCLPFFHANSMSLAISSCMIVGPTPSISAARNYVYKCAYIYFLADGQERLLCRVFPQFLLTYLMLLFPRFLFGSVPWSFGLLSLHRGLQYRTHKSQMIWPMLILAW